MTATGFFTWYRLTRFTQTGSGPTDDALDYVRRIGEHYYPAAVAQISDSDTVYADFYYAFDDIKENFIVVHLHTDVASEISLDNSKIGNFFITGLSLECFGMSSLSFSFSTTITLKAGTVLTFPEKTYDMTPFYNSVMKN